MRKILFGLIAMAAVMMFYSCGQNGSKGFGACRIAGTVDGKQFEGKYVYIMPMSDAATSEKMDSVKIVNGQFEYTPDSMQLYKIMFNDDLRKEAQALLVVAEPGNVWVKMGPTSHAGGTPQNDTLEVWKGLTEDNHWMMGHMRQELNRLKALDDTMIANAYKDRADSIHLIYKKATWRMAKNLKEGPLHDFLDGLFPKTYDKKLPDGRVVTIDAETGEETQPHHHH